MSFCYFVPVFAIVLLILFITSAAIQCLYALYFFTRIFSLPTVPAKKEPALKPVSIVICARNEARNLELNLPGILSQIYRNEARKSMYEVIVVNDASTDNTAAVLQQLEQRYDNLWSVHIQPDATRHLKGKKFALAKGVSHATNDILLFTDADCRPSSGHWLMNMTAPFEEGKEIVVGYGAYDRSGSLLNVWVRWETIHTFLQYATYTLAGKPYMAVGRNMACTKAIFNKAQASEIWNAVPSGDDDLLMSVAATEDNTQVVVNRDAYTVSVAKGSWKDWLRQKQRHMSTGKYYNAQIKNILAIYGISHALCWLLFFSLLPTAWCSTVIVLMSLRCVLYWFIMGRTSFMLGERHIFSLPFFDLAWMLYNFVLSPYILFKNKTRWT